MGRVWLIFRRSIEDVLGDFGTDRASLGFLQSFNPGFWDGGIGGFNRRFLKGRIAGLTRMMRSHQTQPFQVGKPQFLEI
ncbi:hypothetical protein [Oscillatoria sp. HE19RPO]|uniref:hypothetical protein n=1 Tax=Oscillatoria sp. HE19RPO TaxID=2954806 RepID=UPI0020C2B7A7|nr:hypothetical protein [Oscillatoria sp. HE19RPO]